MSRSIKQVGDYNDRIKNAMCSEALREIENMDNERAQNLRVRLRELSKKITVEEFKRLADEIIEEFDRFHDSLLQKPEFKLDAVETKLDGQ
jgi:hypothetical protein